ncbi:MAG TPA: hypothetical protein VHD32_01490 [Candidatus Didemnitutus sp.]|nr:hypothetical protein [Candidatus Didemnitutus sp.]
MIPSRELKLKIWQRACALLFAGLVFALGILGASPDLHSLIHPDADHGNHTCAITLFHQGLDEAAPIIAAAPAPSLVEIGAAVRDGARRPDAHLDRLMPGRGPPSC